MAVVAANLALLLDPTSPWSVVLDRKSRPAAPDVVLNLPKKELHAHAYAARVVSKGFDSDGETRKSHRVVARGKGNSKVDDVDFGAESSDDELNGFDEDDESFDWEKEMKNRVKDIEEMKELEKKAEEVRNQVEEEIRREGKEESEEEKRRRVRRELQKLAKEQAERRATGELMFDLGQRAYGRGKYGEAIKFLEGALTIIPKFTLLGGEIQIWLAMAYDAANRNADCIAVYRQLEKSHPSVSIQRQAANLRYISEAPKIKITDEELVSFPYLSSADRLRSPTGYIKYDTYAAWYPSKAQEASSSKDYWGDFQQWLSPIGLGKTKVFWASLALWLGLVGTALFLQ